MVWTDLRSFKTSSSCSAAASRKFYSYEGSPENVTLPEKCDEKTTLVQFVSENVIGHNTVFQSPFGPRKVVYCDYTASGRSLQFIEDYMQSEVLPTYGSTHTTATHTAMQTTMFRHEARDVVRNAVRASERDCVIFTGSGATGAAVRLLQGLNLSSPPVVLAGPFLHHSALLPWREAGAKVIRIREAADGSVDLHHLKQTLQLETKTSAKESSLGQANAADVGACITSVNGIGRIQLIGCFSAASNVTGVLVDTVAVTMLLHEYGALAFWDYATAAPYVELDMNPVVLGDTRGAAHKDAMFFSMHKFVGGPQAPGVLVAKKSLFRHPVPALPGGGSIFFVSRSSHRFLQEEEEREEGGTPAILGDIRAGLVMQLKQAISVEHIAQINQARVRRLKEFVSSSTNLVVLGPSYPPSPEPCPARLPILSFLVRHEGSGLFLHHNFVTTLLNDLFGVQARGGCACAGPYALDLLGINEELAQLYHQELAEPSGLNRHELRRRQEYSDSELLRPGFVRLGLSFTATDEEVEFVLRSVDLVCREGWKLLPQYSCNHQTGEWKHRRQQVFKGRQWLGNVSYSKGEFSVRRGRDVTAGASYADCLAAAQRIFSDASKAARQFPDTSADQLILSTESQTLRWFLMPSEARRLLLGRDSAPDQVNVANGFEISSLINQTLQDSSQDHSNLVKRESTASFNDISRDSFQSSSTDSSVEPESSTSSDSQNSGVSRKPRVPFSPPSYPLSDFVLKSRPTYVWHQPPRLHYWPFQTRPNAPQKDQVIPEVSNLRHSVQNIAAEDEGKGKGNIVGTDRCEKKLTAYQIELDARRLSLNDNSSSATGNACEINTSICTTEHQNQSRKNSTPNIKSKQVLTEQHHSLQDPNVPRGRSEAIDSRHVTSKEKDSRKVMNGSVRRNGLDNIKTNNSTEFVRFTDNEGDSEVQANFSAVKEVVCETSVDVKRVESLHNGAADLSSNPGEQGASKTNTVNFKGKVISLRAKEALKVREKSPSGKKQVCTDMTCFLPRPQGDMPQLQLKAKWQPPPKHIFNPMVEAMEQFKMIRDGDRVLLCLSGGKDSLSLLHLLHQYQFYARSRGVSFTLGAITVDPESAAYDPRPLIPYLAHLGVPYLFEQQGILQQALSLPDLNSICSFCSRMKRGRIYASARLHRYNVLAFGQHLDDLAESFLMSAFHNGRLRTMKASYNVQEGDLRVIRPLVFVREKHLRHFAESRHLPVIPENCPACFEVPKERHRSKQLLAQQEVLFPQVYASLRTALLPLMAIAGTGIENAVLGKNGALVNSLSTAFLNNDEE